ncbi:MAG: hypothetical protein H0X67_24645 [Acidobacteria bacterium]|nr:hypothetical protein [Acidobacteriota bacterium]
MAPVVTPGEPTPIQQPSEPWLHGGQDLRHVQRRQARRRVERDDAGGVELENKEWRVTPG